MAQDILEYFDKQTYEKHTLGEIQTDFNMSFVIDGTKDSTKVQVLSYSDIKLEPYTIIKHSNTSSWWIVAKDRVQRYQNESGFMYMHTLQLLGAIELLNARDLTDCGFNANTYTLNQFVQRLFNLSSFELTLNSIEWNGLSSSQIVDFIKTYENYTLLSALRDLFNSYNSSIKLTFVETGGTLQAILHITPRVGNRSLPILNISDFTGVEEIRSNDKSSFGTCVVSNVENAISTEVKRFPSTGSCVLSADALEVTWQTGIIRLPTPAYKVNKLKMSMQRYKIYIGNQAQTMLQAFYVNIYNDYSWDTLYNGASSWLRSNVSDDAANEFIRFWDTIKQRIIDSNTIVFYDGMKYNYDMSHFYNYYSKESKAPVFINAKYEDQAGQYYAREVSLVDENEQLYLKEREQGISWARGKDTIGPVYFFNYSGNVNTLIARHDSAVLDAGVQNIYTGVHIAIIPDRGLGNNYLKFRVYDDNQHYQPCFVVEYIPMADIKLKVDNDNDSKDTQLYNQNGKLTDSKAFSKLLNSYSNEISSDKITRYKTYYNFSNIPKCGQLVQVGNELYVINNVSLDFNQNEVSTAGTVGYCINGEFTMSKYYAVKSLMTNPNTNIRDYMIPQKFNVKRKQLYRDYFEFDFTSDTNSDSSYYLKLSQLNLFDPQVVNDDLTAFMKIGGDFYGWTQTIVDDNPVNTPYNIDYYYFQLPTIRFTLEKMFVILLDFKDNNIIGYASQTTWTGITIATLFQDNLKNYVAPVQYTDDNGRFNSIEIKFCNDYQTTLAYDKFVVEEQPTDDGYSLYNTMVYIPERVYQLISSEYQFLLSENNYNKDAVEVPVFEYIMQFGDNSNVEMGANIFSRNVENDYAYYYGFANGNANSMSILNANTISTYTLEVDGDYIKLQNACKFTISGDDTKLTIGVYRYMQSMDYGTFEYGDNIGVTANKDYAFFRFKVKNDTVPVVVERELLFIVHNVPSTSIDSNGMLELKINHYKLK